MSIPPLVLDEVGIHEYMHSVWPDASHSFRDRLSDLRPGFLRYSMATGPRHLRPGGTLSGPTLMGAVDAAAFALVLAHLGAAALAVTSHLSIDFLRRPGPGVLIVDVELLKLGRTQITMSTRVHIDDPASPPVAAATVGYSRALLTSDQERP